MPTTPRQQAIAALESVNKLPEHSRSVVIRTKAALNTQILTDNMLAYFEACLVDDLGRGPAFSMAEFTDALAAATLRLGQRQRYGIAVLQTLVHELQDHINQK